jgi:hypothetical protein
VKWFVGCVCKPEFNMDPYGWKSELPESDSWKSLISSFSNIFVKAYKRYEEVESWPYVHKSAVNIVTFESTAHI